MGMQRQITLYKFTIDIAQCLPSLGFMPGTLYHAHFIMDCLSVMRTLSCNISGLIHLVYHSEYVLCDCVKCPTMLYNCPLYITCQVVSTICNCGLWSKMEALQGCGNLFILLFIVQLQSGGCSIKEKHLNWFVSSPLRDACEDEAMMSSMQLAQSGIMSSEGASWAPPVGSNMELQPKTNLMHFKCNRTHLVVGDSWHLAGNWHDPLGCF